MKKKSLHGFTLIELLVVLACLAIMMSMIYPVFIGMTQRAFGAKDMNNMRQIGMALQTYLNDKEQVIPQINAAPGTGTDLLPVIYPVYIATRKVFQSPFDKRPASEDVDAPVSYGINQNAYDLINANMLSVKSPASTILMAPNYNGDPALRASWTGKAATAPYVPNLQPGGGAGMTIGTHLKGTQINALFFDLHVETMTFGPSGSPAVGSFKDTNSVPLGVKHWNPTQ
jgi:prepilin-type N-terminal cleavage/methylation domain-containing protein/prepilin-type processing-associated H-X9-DG protein